MKSQAQNSFRMRVIDIFSLRNEVTIFIGNIIDGPAFIKKCICELYLDGKLVQKLDVEGEMMPTAKNTAAGLRSISSTTKIEISVAKPFLNRVYLVAHSTSEPTGQYKTKK